MRNWNTLIVMFQMNMFHLRIYMYDSKISIHLNVQICICEYVQCIFVCVKMLSCIKRISRFFFAFVGSPSYLLIKMFYQKMIERPIRLKK